MVVRSGGFSWAYYSAPIGKFLQDGDGCLAALAKYGAAGGGKGVGRRPAGTSGPTKQRNYLTQMAPEHPPLAHSHFASGLKKLCAYAPEFSHFIQY